MNDPDNIKIINVKRQPLTHREKEVIKKRHRYTCIYCNCNNRLIITIEHKIPLIRGGNHSEENTTVSCAVCNSLKGELTHDEFKLYLDELEGLHALKKIKVKIDRPIITFHPHHTPGLEN